MAQAARAPDAVAVCCGDRLGHVRGAGGAGEPAGAGTCGRPGRGRRRWSACAWTAARRWWSRSLAVVAGRGGVPAAGPGFPAERLAFTLADARRGAGGRDRGGAGVRAGRAAAAGRVDDPRTMAAAGADSGRWPPRRPAAGRRWRMSSTRRGRPGRRRVWWCRTGRWRTYCRRGRGGLTSWGRGMRLPLHSSLAFDLTVTELCWCRWRTGRGWRSSRAGGTQALAELAAERPVRARSRWFRRTLPLLAGLLPGGEAAVWRGGWWWAGRRWPGPRCGRGWSGHRAWRWSTSTGRPRRRWGAACSR